MQGPAQLSIRVFPFVSNYKGSPNQFPLNDGYEGLQLSRPLATHERYIVRIKIINNMLACFYDKI